MADTNTDNFALLKPEPATGGWDAKYHILCDQIDSALLDLFAMGQLAVIDKDLAEPPGAPTDRDIYIIAVGAIDAWAGHDGKVAIWSENAGAWAMLTPADGWEAWLLDEGKLYRHNGAAWVISAIEKKAARNRQTVLSGKIDANGYPDYLSNPAGLNVSIDAAETGLVLNFSDGLYDYKYIETADQVVVVPDDDSSALCAEYDPVADSVAYSFISFALEPVYAAVAPAIPVIGSLWFSTIEMRMYEYDGALWVPVIKLVIGFVVAIGGIVGVMDKVAFNGRYVTPIFPISGVSSYSYKHGMREGHENVVAHAYALSGADDLTKFTFEKTYNSNGAYIASLDSSSVLLRTFSTPSYLTSGGGRSTATHARMIVERIW